MVFFVEIFLKLKISIFFILNNLCLDPGPDSAKNLDMEDSTPGNPSK